MLDTRAKVRPMRPRLPTCPSARPPTHGCDEGMSASIPGPARPRSIGSSGGSAIDGRVARFIGEHHTLPGCLVLVLRRRALDELRPHDPDCDHRGGPWAGFSVQRGYPPKRSSTLLLTGGSSRLILYSFNTSSSRTLSK